MPDEILLTTAEELDELLSEPGNNDLAVVHTATGSKKAKWSSLLAWLFKAGRITGLMIGDGEISQNKLATNSVSQVKILNGAVAHEKLAVDSVRGANIMDGEVSGAKLASGSITHDKLGTNSVTQAKIVNASVVHEKIGQDAVRGVNILDGEVSGSKLASGSITHDKLAANSVRSVKIEDGAVGTSKLADEAVSTDKIADGAVTGEKLRAGLLNGLAHVYTLRSVDATGNVSEESPPDYAVDSEYTHVWPNVGVANPVVMLEQRNENKVEIKSRSVGGGNLTVVVKGETGREIDYRLIVMEIIE